MVCSGRGGDGGRLVVDFLHPPGLAPPQSPLRRPSLLTAAHQPTSDLLAYQSACADLLRTSHFWGPVAAPVEERGEGWRARQEGETGTDGLKNS